MKLVDYIGNKPKYLAKRLTASVYQGLKDSIDSLGRRNYSTYLAVSHRLPSPAEKLNRKHFNVPS